MIHPTDTSVANAAVMNAVGFETATDTTHDVKGSILGVVLQGQGARRNGTRICKRCFQMASQGQRADCDVYRSNQYGAMVMLCQ